MNKAGIELSVNFLVMFILTIVVLGFGITIARTIFSTSSDLAEASIEELDRNIENLFCQGENVICIGRNTRTMKSKEFQTFTLHVINILGQRQDFTYEVSLGPAFDTNQNALPNELAFIPISRTVTLDNTEEQSFAIGVQVPGNTQKGTYALNVKVLDENNNLYGGNQRIYINVD